MKGLEEKIVHMNWGWYGLANGFYNIYPFAYQDYVSPHEYGSNINNKYNYTNLKTLCVYKN